jgi:hypothetical protein
VARLSLTSKPILRPGFSGGAMSCYELMDGFENSLNLPITGFFHLYPSPWSVWPFLKNRQNGVVKGS